MEITEQRLGAEHLAGCLALSRAANWNQNEADWRLMLELGRGWGLFLPDGTPVASTLALPYGGRFAWVSMVLVLPEHRRKGYASRLLRVALADLENRGLTPILDATPAGREVYLKEGFRDSWGFERYLVKDTKRGEGGAARPIREADWKAIVELDEHAFGASREALLRALAERLPQAALVVEGKGFLLGRDGREARQLGPLVARDGETARELLGAALARVPGPLYLDIPDHAAIERREFVLQRPYTRMVRGAKTAPGTKDLVFLVAGPELG